MLHLWAWVKEAWILIRLNCMIWLLCPPDTIPKTPLALLPSSSVSPRSIKMSPSDFLLVPVCSPAAWSSKRDFVTLFPEPMSLYCQSRTLYSSVWKSETISCWCPCLILVLLPVYLYHCKAPLPRTYPPSHISVLPSTGSIASVQVLNTTTAEICQNVDCHHISGTFN